MARRARRDLKRAREEQLEGEIPADAEDLVEEIDKYNDIEPHIHQTYSTTLAGITHKKPSHTKTLHPQMY